MTTTITASANGHARLNGKPSKMDFVIKHNNLKAKEISELAKKSGIELSIAHVYNLRSQAKHKGVGKLHAQRGGVQKTARALARKRARLHPELRDMASLRDEEQQFLKLALDLGFGRAASLLAAYRARCDRVLGE